MRRRRLFQTNIVQQVWFDQHAHSRAHKATHTAQRSKDSSNRPANLRQIIALTSHG
jgi:hypothetical protein